MTGAGRAFCAGADVRDGAGSAGTFPGTFWEKPTINSFESGLELFKPTIAAVNGACLGYALTAVTFCDFVIASELATFGMPEVRLGVPTIVGAIRLPQRLRWEDAMELLLTGDTVDAVRAKEMGIVGRVVPHERLMDEARELAWRLCRAAPLAARAVKEMAVRSREMGWTEAVRFGETMRLVAAATEDARGGPGRLPGAADARLEGPLNAAFRRRLSSRRRAAVPARRPARRRPRGRPGGTGTARHRSARGSGRGRSAAGPRAARSRGS